MTSQELTEQIFKKQTFLCVGLDTDIEKIPTYLLSEKDPVFSFNKAIIDATHESCVAYKPNIAFYEALGASGWKSLKKTIEYLHTEYPELYTIADAKRGDIGNTSRMYAKAFFEDLGFDSITVAPYMGKDSVEPFLEFENKHTISRVFSSLLQSIISGFKSLTFLKFTFLVPPKLVFLSLSPSGCTQKWVIPTIDSSKPRSTSNSV